MRQKIIKIFIITFSTLVVLFPLWVRGQALQWAFDSTLPANIFPMFGLAGYGLLWLHVVGPAFEPWLSRFVNFNRFLKETSPIILVLMLLHPIILLIIMNFSINALLISYPVEFILLGFIGLVLLLTFDVAKVFKKYDIVARNRNKVLVTSTLGFILIFFHSIGIGGDLQSGLLRAVWIFYGVSAILSAIYVYGIRRFFN